MTYVPGHGPYSEKLSDNTFALRHTLLGPDGLPLFTKDASGNLPVAMNANRATFAAVFTAFVPGLTVLEDYFTLENPVGSGKIIRLIASLLKIKSSGAVGLFAQTFIVHRTSLNTGGTPTPISAKKYNSASPNPVGLVKTFTADKQAPLGTENFREIIEYTLPVSTGAYTSLGATSPITMGNGVILFYEPVILREGEMFAWNNNNAAFQANFTARGNMLWTEE